MDKIVLTRMEFYGNHGVFPEENRLGQRFLVDAELFMALDRAGRTDSLEETVNYADIYHLIQDFVEKKTFKLIEALAEHIATAVLQTYTEVSEITVRVLKPHPPFKIFFEGVTVEIHRKRAALAFIGLGSNLGDREDLLDQAIRRMDGHPQIRIMRCSSIYETDPVGMKDQPAFLNMAVAVETGLPPESLLDAMLEIERGLGRVRDVRWGPRTVDLDLLLYDGQRIRTGRLTVPHPRMGERPFVMVPLMEIAWDAPGADMGWLAERYRKLEQKEGVRLWKQMYWHCE